MTNRHSFVEKLGKMPAACPLSPRLIERVDHSDHAREKVEFEASPGVVVPAYLLIPKRATHPSPAVLCIHQHNGEYHLGKSEPTGLAGDPNMHYALELCRRGYVAIAPDLECFEERRASVQQMARWERKGGGPKAGAYEWLVATRYLAEGSCLQARYVRDLARAVDYLVTRPEVDPDRLGVMGHSLGGQEAMWTLLADRRLKAGVCSCGIGTLETIIRDGINHNLAMYVPGLLEVGDIDELVAALAPSAFLMTAGTDDGIFPIDGVRQIAQSATEAYRTENFADRYQYLEFQGGHSFSPDIRETAYRWLDRWLKG